MTRDKTTPGPKPMKIDYAKVEQMAQDQCTDAEIGRCIGFTVQGFIKRKKSDDKLVEALEIGRAHGATSLRRLQWQLAQEGNATMLVWLGKNYLSQTDKLEQKNDGDVNITIKHPDRNRKMKVQDEPEQ
jgi:hypothetical protein